MFGFGSCVGYYIPFSMIYLFVSNREERVVPLFFFYTRAHWCFYLKKHKDKILHNKKQAQAQITRTIRWNTKRGNIPESLNWDLEIAMLQEELDELKEATEDVDRLDALLDLKFVLTGSIGKMGLSSEQYTEAYECVINANEQKSEKKNADGKITKPEGFISPEPLLQEILNKR